LGTPQVPTYATSNPTLQPSSPPSLVPSTTPTTAADGASGFWRYGTHLPFSCFLSLVPLERHRLEVRGGVLCGATWRPVGHVVRNVHAGWCARRRRLDMQRRVAHGRSPAAPVVSSVLGGNTASTGGSGLVVGGMSFDFQDYTATAGVADASCTTTSWTSSTSAFCVGGFAMQARSGSDRAPLDVV
jgi:hypothetical protein